MNEPSDADLEKRRAALVEQWKREVKPRAAVIDPRNEHDGWALTLG